MTEQIQPPSRRAPLHPEINRDMIVGLVHRFYDRVRQDPMLGPIFNAKITDWAPHLETMVEFWSSVTMMSGTFHGRPMEKHAQLSGIDGVHFSRWLELFAMTVRELCPPAVAAIFMDRSVKIAESLQLGMARACAANAKRMEKAS